MSRSNVEEIIGVLWAILASQLQPWSFLFYIAVTLSAVSIVAAIVMAVRDLRAEREIAA